MENWRNHYWLTRQKGVSARAVEEFSSAAIWTVWWGSEYGWPKEYIALEGFDGGFLVANTAGNDAFHGQEPGEVWIQENGTQHGQISRGERDWFGWWSISSTRDDPPPGDGPLTWLGDAGIQVLSFLASAFSKPSGGTTISQTPPPSIACDQLPPVVQSSTEQRVHASCSAYDFSGPYYPQNDPYVARRVQCDAAPHIAETNHKVDSVVCSVGENTRACPNVH